MMNYVYIEPDELEIELAVIRHEISGGELIGIGVKVIAAEDGENEIKHPSHKVPFGTGNVYSCESVGVVINYCTQRYAKDSLAYIIVTPKGISVVRPEGLKIEPNE